ncbi:MAG: AhpC/TSA family protein [Bacteroidales bacterium]|nr:AhpC/TSA family protein [Bacteroidales bacterium]
MRNIRNIAVGTAIAASAILMLASCAGDHATISATLSDAPETDVTIKLLNINRYDILDTVKTDAAGKFSYKVQVKKQEPEFIYLFHGDTQVAALLLSSGEKASVSADTLGNYTVTGSPESAKLQEVDRAYAEFVARANAILGRFEAAKEGSDEAKEAQQELSREYVSYYRDRMKYVMSNSRSLTVVPVMYQTVGSNGMPLFSQETDAIFFGNICDSLETVYPASPYVKALRAEATRRFSDMDMSRKIRNADEVGYVDLELPDVNGVKRRLSEVDAKVILVYFWSTTVPLQKMFNIEVLQPVYETYKDKGLEIYQIAVDTDKATWARIVKDQGLTWINLCDGLGDYSPVLQSWNVTQSPASFLLVDGQLSAVKFTSAAELRKLLDKALK